MIYSDRRPWMTDDQWRCAQLFADVFGGFHHLPEIKQFGTGVKVRPYSIDLASYDFSHMTHLVILAHVRCIRVSVTSSGMKLALHAWARDPMAKETMKGHATLRQAIERFAPGELIYPATVAPATADHAPALDRCSAERLGLGTDLGRGDGGSTKETTC